MNAGKPTMPSLPDDAYFKRRSVFDCREQRDDAAGRKINATDSITRIINHFPKTRGNGSNLGNSR